MFLNDSLLLLGLIAFVSVAFVCFVVLATFFSSFSLRMQESRLSLCWMNKGVSHSHWQKLLI